MPYGSGTAHKAMKANRTLLPKRKKNKFSYASSKSNDEIWIDPKQATLEQLIEIRTKIRKQRKQRTYKILVVLLLTIVVIFLVFILTDWGLIFTPPS